MGHGEEVASLPLIPGWQVSLGARASKLPWGSEHKGAFCSPGMRYLLGGYRWILRLAVGGCLAISSTAVKEGGRGCSRWVWPHPLPVQSSQLSPQRVKFSTVLFYYFFGFQIKFTRC